MPSGFVFASERWKIPTVVPDARQGTPCQECNYCRIGNISPRSSGCHPQLCQTSGPFSLGHFLQLYCASPSLSLFCFLAAGAIRQALTDLEGL